MNSIAVRPITPQRAETTHRYDALMQVLRDRTTTREFDPSYSVPQAHYDMVLEAAALAPSGANAQPWHYVVVTSAWTKRAITDHFMAEQARQARNATALLAVNYAGMATAPGFVVVVTDPRMSWAYPGLMEGSELDQRYHANAERITLQSVAASTMAAHLAAAALGYQVWWVSLLGQDEARIATQALLGVPDDLRITDFMLFGPSLLPAPKRWKKQVAQIVSYDRFNMDNYKSVEQIDDWMRDLRHRALAHSETKKLR
jgi:5,6-dimethylbenzimidazole synthase